MTSPAPENGCEDTQIGPKELYASVTQHILGTEQTSWNRFSNFLTANSIFFLAWATIYVEGARLPSILTVTVMVAVCIVGILSSVVWARLGRRSRKNVDLFLNMGEEMEKEWLRDRYEKLRPCAEARELRDKGEYRSSGSYAIMVYGPYVFTALYVLLLHVTLRLWWPVRCCQ